MRVHVLFTFDDNDPLSLLPRKFTELESFYVSHRTAEEAEITATKRLEPHQLEHPNLRGIRSVGRLRSGAFMREDLEAYLAYFAVLIERAEATLQGLVVEREQPILTARDRRAYDGLTDALRSSIAWVRRTTAEIAQDMPQAFAGATPSDRHP
jgi:hypothetical protein